MVLHQRYSVKKIPIRARSECPGVNGEHAESRPRPYDYVSFLGNLDVGGDLQAIRMPIEQMCWFKGPSSYQFPNYSR